MDVKLVISKGAAKKQTIRLRTDETVIGRQKGCDLRIPSATVSRRHCLLRFQQDYLTIEDLDSSNGTFLNGERITRKEVVRPGDRLEVGPLVFVVQYQLTQAAIDLLLRGDPLEGEAEAFVEVEPVDEPLPLAEEDPNTVKVDASDAKPKDAQEDAAADEVIEGVPILDDAEGWKLPPAGDLRDILSHLDDKNR
jgi:predicted component of type VI protein secretion system